MKIVSHCNRLSTFGWHICQVSWNFLGELQKIWRFFLQIHVCFSNLQEFFYSNLTTLRRIFSVMPKLIILTDCGSYTMKWARSPLVQVMAWLYIAQIGPLSFQAAIEHKPRQVRWVGCTLQWSLSGGQHVCISNPQGSIKEATKENLKCKTFTT